MQETNYASRADYDYQDTPKRMNKVPLTASATLTAASHLYSAFASLT
jgi:hypothetical protein